MKDVGVSLFTKQFTFLGLNSLYPPLFVRFDNRRIDEIALCD